MGGEGLWFGGSAPTNNVAEAHAMVAGLRWVVAAQGSILSRVG